MGQVHYGSTLSWEAAIVAQLLYMSATYASCQVPRVFHADAREWKMQVYNSLISLICLIGLSDQK